MQESSNSFYYENTRLIRKISKIKGWENASYVYDAFNDLIFEGQNSEIKISNKIIINEYWSFRKLELYAENDISQQPYTTYLDENRNPLVIEIGGFNNRWELALKYIYTPEKQVFCKVHPKVYVPALHSIHNDSACSITEGKNTFGFRCGKVFKISSRISPDKIETYYYRNDSLFAYSEHFTKTKAFAEFLLFNDTIKFVQSIKLKQDTSPKALSLKLLSIKKKSVDLFNQARKLGYKLYFSSKEIYRDNLIINLTPEDFKISDSIYISNPDYKIKQILFGGIIYTNDFSGGDHWDCSYFLKTSKLAEIKSSLLVKRKRIYIELEIENKQKQIERITIEVQ